jgi:hypothetical protein
MGHHGWNGYRDHVFQIHKRSLEMNSLFLDEMADPKQSFALNRGRMDLEPNRIYQERSSGAVADDIFYGVFVLRVPGDKTCRFQFFKRLELKEEGGQLKSRTIEYSYTVIFSLNSDSVVLRFDNLDEHWDFETAHHFHLDRHSAPTGTKKKIKAKDTHPAHVGNEYPHVSDLFDLALSDVLLVEDSNGVLANSSALFSKIPVVRKKDPNDWIPVLDKYYPVLNRLIATGTKVGRRPTKRKVAADVRRKSKEVPRSR